MKIVTKKQDAQSILLVLASIAIVVGVMLRDIGGVGINKYILLFFAAVPIFLLPCDKLVIMISFLIPLYVGIPGNYISLCILIRLVYEALRGRLKCDTTFFLISCVVTMYIFISNFIYNDMGVYNIVGAMDFLLMGLLVSLILQCRMERKVIIAFSIGVAIVGVIMLCTTLKYFTLADLMSGSSRLGFTGMLGEQVESNMVTTIDPNFYSMNVIAVLSSMYLIMTDKNQNKRLFLLGVVLTAVLICLIGLSRTFLVVLALWGVLVLFTEQNLKRALIFTMCALVMVIIFINAFPTVIQGLTERLVGADIVGGNGRIRIIIDQFDSWQQSAVSIFFGGGLYNNNTHSAPLLYIFGLGLLGTGIVYYWFTRAISLCRKLVQRKGFRFYIPLLTTFIVFSSIPAAGCINATYPMVVAILAIGLARREVTYELQN